MCNVICLFVIYSMYSKAKYNAVFKIIYVLPIDRKHLDDIYFRIDGADITIIMKLG